MLGSLKFFLLGLICTSCLGHCVVPRMYLQRVGGNVKPPLAKLSALCI